MFLLSVMNGKVSRTNVTLLAQSSEMIEEKFMRRAIDLALRAEAHSISPNPRVGAMLVHEGRVIGEGYHSRVGAGHAEVNCLANVRPGDTHLIPYSTMYVTLEPCAHDGRTPSCARRLVHERVQRVVVGTVDPFPLVKGKGVQILREGGVEVVVPFLEEECRDAAKVFLTGQTLHRPYIALKWAESADGYVDRERDSDLTPPVTLSSPFTRMLVHYRRSTSMGILVGRRTYDLDHPSLTNRDWHLSPHSPRPILVSSSRPADLPSHWLHITEISQAEMHCLLKEEGITSLLIEGGTRTHLSCIKLGLWDEIHREVAPMCLREGVPAPVIPADAVLSSCREIDRRRLEQWSRVF